MDPEMQQLAAQLAASTIRNSASTVAEKIRLVKTTKRDNETIVELEDIINELIADKVELTRIAQAFQEEIVAQRITDAEVEYIGQTVVPLLEQLVRTAGMEQADIDKFLPTIKSLVSVETVTLLQLFGFNFKRAVGEPLTEVVSRLVKSAMRQPGDMDYELQIAQAQRETTLMEVAQDAEASYRLRAFFSAE